MARNSPRGTPARIVLVFSLLTAVVAVSAWRDRHRAGLSRTGWPSAVGDEEFYETGSGPLALGVEGRMFRLVEENGERVALRDDLMWRVPLALSRPRVYAPEQALPQDRLPRLFVKAGHGQYVEMRLVTAAE
jgi:hypothetical protein